MNWYYATNGSQKGPVPLEELKSRIARGEVSPTDLAWREGMPDWMPVSTIPELKAEEPAPTAAADVPPPASGPLSSPAPEPYRTPAHSGPAPSGVPLAPPSQGMAVASMICGILCLIGCCIWYLALPMALVAVVLGHIASGKATKEPQRYTGKGMARAGLVTGYLGLFFSLLFAVFSLQFVGLSEQEAQEKVIRWFPEDVQKQMREQLEQKRQESAPAVEP